MGTCECMRRDEDNNEINITFKDKKNYNDDYDTTNRGKARAVNNQFSLVDQDDEEEDDKRKRLVIVKEENYEDDIPIRDGIIEVDDVMIDIVDLNTEAKTEEQDNNDDFIVTFKKEAKTTLGKKKGEPISIVNKGFYMNTTESIKQVEQPKTVENQKQKEEESRAPVSVLDHSKLDRSALSGDSDIDETIFNSAKFSKELFALLNSVKTKPKSILEKVKSFIIPKGSPATENNRQEVIDFIESLSDNHKGKSYLWNEKVYSALRPIYQRKANGEIKESINVQEIIENQSVKGNIDSHFEVTGRFDKEHKLLCLLLEHSKHINKILLDSSTISTICSVQSKNRLKIITCLVLIKKK